MISVCVLLDTAVILLSIHSNHFLRYYFEFGDMFRL